VIRKKSPKNKSSDHLTAKKEKEAEMPKMPLILIPLKKKSLKVDTDKNHSDQKINEEDSIKDCML
jgi:hypothetical protein